MELKIKVISDDEGYALQQSQNLKNWIENDEELGAVKVKQERKELQPDEAGGALLAGIQVLSSSALEPVAKTVQVWMEERARRTSAEFSLELEDPSGKKFRINSKNLGESDQDFVTEIVKRFEGDKDYDYKITQQT